MSEAFSPLLPEIHLDPAAASQDKRERRRRLNVGAYPIARLVGNGLVLAAVYLHNRFILGDHSPGGFAALAIGLLAYSLLSWIVLAGFYDRVRSLDLGDVFLTLDVVAWTFAIYASGGDRSWLFFLMMIRAADQRLAGLRRVLIFGHVSVASYALMIASLVLVEHRAVVWPAELTKLAMIYAANVYLALAAQTTEGHRAKLAAAIRMARESLATSRQSEERYRSLFETVSDPIVTADLDGRVTAVNRALETATGYTREELIGRHFSVLTTPAVAEASEERIRRAVGGEPLTPAEIIGIHKDGTPVPYEVRSAVIRDGEGRPIGLVGIYRDIRERKRHEEALLRAREAAERGNRAKSQFLARMSHELRTPLNSIIGFSRVLLRRTEGDLTPRQASFLESMGQSARHLLQIINGVLDLARIEAGKLEVSLDEVELGPLVTECVSSFRPLADDKGLALDLDVADDLPVIRADATKVRQAVLNLLSNAIKFTQAGRVGVSVRARPDAVLVSVRDTGPGIPAHELPRLFEPFRDNPLARERGGTGLGLAITKSFVELHGGSLWVETLEQRGSTFHFSLPLTD